MSTSQSTPLFLYLTICSLFLIHCLLFICLFLYLFTFLLIYLCIYLFIVYYHCFREQYGIPVLVKLLEAMPFDGVTAAAADALRALAMSNEANKTAIREAWAVPLLVKLLGSEVHIASPDAHLSAFHIFTNVSIIML